jgi:hypothetical protein
MALRFPMSKKDFLSLKKAVELPFITLVVAKYQISAFFSN